MGQDTHICLDSRLDGPSHHPDDLAMKAHPFRNRKALCLLSKKFCTFRCGGMIGEVENTCPVVRPLVRRWCMIHLRVHCYLQSDDFCLESAWRRMRRRNEVCWGCRTLYLVWSQMKSTRVQPDRKYLVSTLPRLAICVRYYSRTRSPANNLLVRVQVK